MTSQSQFNIAAKSQEERDKVNVDLAASGFAYKERLNAGRQRAAGAPQGVFHGASSLLPRAEHPTTSRFRSALHRDGRTEYEEVTLYAEHFDTVRV